MASVSIRELRNHGGEVVERVMAGETVTVTRAGTPVAELRPLARRGVGRATLLETWRRLPSVDEKAFREDLDRIFDPRL
jgi:prevent-host-death family protein